MRLVYWLCAGCFFTASFDIWLIVNLGGQVRISQLLLLLVCFAAAARTLQDGRILWPRGSIPLVIWLGSQFAFFPLALVPAMALQFLALISLTIAGTFAVVQLFGRSLDLAPLMRMYLSSYVVIAIFGLTQFILPLFHLPGLFVRQWILHGRIARINGFNYEPSYYVTYLMMGWIMLVDLRYSSAHITSGRKWKWFTYLVTASLFLSTSRTAWIIMFVELLARAFPFLLGTLRSMYHQSLRGQMLARLPRRRLVLTSIVFVIAVIASARALVSLVNPIAFLEGTGLAGTAAHSYNDRAGNVFRTFDGFIEHPFIGRSLGGVAPYLASRDGIIVHSLDEARLYEGFPVPLEVLVASGIFGGIAFGLYIYRNTFGALRLARSRWPDEQARWLRALGRAMIFECFMLCTDQNLLRVYVWFHLTMVTLVAYNLEYVRAPHHAGAAIDPPLYPSLEPSPAP